MSAILCRLLIFVLLQVPPGTILYRRDAGENETPVAELVLPGERALLAGGGRGGRGNASFKTGRNKYGLSSVGQHIDAVHHRL